jgi:hypothetical protein
MRGMTKNILEWGWHTSSPNSSAASDWKPAPTLLGGHDIDVAAAGDLWCQGICGQGGSRGTTGAYDVDETIMCRNCAVKTLKIENLPGGQQNLILRRYELQAK